MADYPAAGPYGATGDTPKRDPLALGIPADVFERLADDVAARVVERLAGSAAPSPWLDVEAAASYLACPTSRIYDLVAARRVQCARDGRRLLFRAEWLDAGLS